MTTALNELDAIRKRPGMYFSAPKEHYLHSLDAFIRGLNFSLPNPKIDIGPGFSKWLVKEMKMKGSENLVWTKILELNFPDIEEAYDCFFKLAEEYSQKK